MKKIVILSAFVLAGCFPEPEPIVGLDAKLIVASASPDYATSDIALIGNTEEKNDVVVENLVSTTNPSDIRIGFDGSSIYRLGRYGFDNVTKINLNTEQVALNVDWQYSVLGDDFSANPYDIILLNSQRGYVSRAGSVALWQINLSAAQESAFKEAEIDLSTLANAASGNSFMADMEVVDGKLFVLLTGLDDNWSATSNSRIAVINTATNELIDTDTTQAGVQGIDLPVRNASNFTLHQGLLYVSAVGDAYNYSDTTHKYSGGVVTVNTDTYASTLLIDDGDAASAPYGNVTQVTVSATNDVYFSGSASYGNDHLFVRTDLTGDIAEVKLGEGTYNISSLASRGAEVYVGVFAQADGSETAGIHVINATTQTPIRFIPMSFQPTQIVVVP